MKIIEKTKIELMQKTFVEIRDEKERMIAVVWSNEISIYKFEDYHTSTTIEEITIFEPAHINIDDLRKHGLIKNISKESKL